MEGSLRFDMPGLGERLDNLWDAGSNEVRFIFAHIRAVVYRPGNKLLYDV